MQILKRTVLALIASSIGFAIVSFTACTSTETKKPQEHMLGIQLGLLHYGAEQFRREQEWPLNHGNKEAAPTACLAFSGGGIRSASFAIGVLKGLQNSRKLQQVDVISAVSGGGYALGWMYSLLHSSHSKQLSDIFTDSEIDLLTKKSKFVGNSLAGFIAHTVTSPLQVLNNLLSYLGSNSKPHSATDETGLYGRAYADAIADTFLGRRKDLRLADLAPLIHDKKVPLFILNAAIVPEGTHSVDHILLAPAVEFSPLRNWGYSIGELADQSQLRENDFLWKFESFVNADIRRDVAYLHDALSISGSAIDFHRENNFSNQALNALGLSLGRRFALKMGTSGGEYRFVYLVDGGFSENLGAVPLVQRRCSNILIVDAEYDPNFHFGAYVKLKRLLRDEYQTVLNIPALDALLNTKLVNSEKTGELCAGQGCRIEQFTGSQPVFYGTALVPSGGYYNATATPWKEFTWEETSLKVTYVKLSVDAERLSKIQKDGLDDFYPAALSKYIASNKSAECAPEHLYDCQSPFPQKSTLNQIFTPEQMRAYVDLGEFTVQHHLSKWNDENP